MIRGVAGPAAFILTAMTFACASPQKGSASQKRSAPAPGIVSGALTRPMNRDLALGFVREKQDVFDDCYEREYLSGNPQGASYVFEVTIPAAQLPHGVMLLRSSNSEKPELELCLTEALKSVRFPGHTASKTFVTELRIEGGNPSDVNEPIAMLE